MSISDPKTYLNFYPTDDRPTIQAVNANVKWEDAPAPGDYGIQLKCECESQDHREKAKSKLV